MELADSGAPPCREVRVHGFGFAWEQLGRNLLLAEDMDHALLGALEVTGRFLDAEFGAFWAPDPVHDVVRTCAVWHRSSPPNLDFEAAAMHTAFRRGVGLVGAVWDRGEPGWVEDTLRDRNFPLAPHAAQAGFRSAIAFPVRDARRIPGIIEFLGGSLRRPDGQLLECLAAIGDRIGGFVADCSVEHRPRSRRESGPELLFPARDRLLLS